MLSAFKSVRWFCIIVFTLWLPDVACAAVIIKTNLFWIYFVELKASNFLLTKCCLFTVVFNHIAQRMSSRTNGANHFWISNRHSHAKTTEIHTQQFIYICTKNLTRRRLLVKHFLYFWNWTKLFHKEAQKWLKRLTCTRSVIPTRYHSFGSPDSDVVFGSTQTSHLFN